MVVILYSTLILHLIAISKCLVTESAIWNPIAISASWVGFSGLPKKIVKAANIVPIKKA